MSSVESLKRFLEVMANQRSSGPAAHAQDGGWPFVTISRQTGAGGHTLGEALLEAMRQQRDDVLFQGWEMFDHALCRKVLEDPQLKVSMESLLAEGFRSQTEDLLLELVSHQTPQYVVMKKIFETIEALATVGKVVLVGRAGSVVTRRLPLGVHVRLVASEPTRVHRMRQLLDVGEEEARAAVKKQDSDRARLLRTYFQREIDDPLLYHAVWNTELVSITAIASSIIGLIKDKVASKGRAKERPRQDRSSSLTVAAVSAGSHTA